MTRQSSMEFDSPMGEVRCSLDGREQLTELKLLGPAGKAGERPVGPFAEIASQLEEYFAGVRREFDIPLAPEGTEFQRSVWNELVRVPYGSTTTYSELARKLGNPDALRAVGAANGANPIWIIIPCHRVIGADGSLTGYAGGLDVKRRLLELEGALQPRLFS